MIFFNDFSFLETISIEIGPECNLKHLHKKCPINYRKNIANELTVDQVTDIMDQAVNLNFNGLFAFHFYNEPLLYANKIAEIKKNREKYKLLLWTNGTLISDLSNNGYDFSIFDKIVITKYKEIEETSFSNIKNFHPNVFILEENMDDRINFYESTKKNYLSCKKIYVELPIDCEGNVYICTYDWKKKYLLGNLIKQNLNEILMSESYQNLLKGNTKRFQHCKDLNNLCKFCPRPYIRTND